MKYLHPDIWAEINRYAGSVNSALSQHEFFIFHDLSSPDRFTADQIEEIFSEVESKGMSCTLYLYNRENLSVDQSDFLLPNRDGHAVCINLLRQSTVWQEAATLLAASSPQQHRVIDLLSLLMRRSMTLADGLCVIVAKGMDEEIAEAKRYAEQIKLNGYESMLAMPRFDRCPKSAVEIDGGVLIDLTAESSSDNSDNEVEAMMIEAAARENLHLMSLQISFELVLKTINRLVREKNIDSSTLGSFLAAYLDKSKIQHDINKSLDYGKTIYSHIVATLYGGGSPSDYIASVVWHSLPTSNRNHYTALIRASTLALRTDGAPNNFVNELMARALLVGRCVVKPSYLSGNYNTLPESRAKRRVVTESIKPGH